MDSSRYHQPARGFTLIELLVVIAIISILASILFPVFARARGKGYQTQCLSNMKQIGTAIFMYRSDYNGTWAPASLPDDTPKPPNATAWQTWKPWIGYDTTPKPKIDNYDTSTGDMRQPATNPVHPGMVDIYIKSQDVKRCPVQPKNAQMILAANCWATVYGQLGGFPLEYGPFGKNYYGVTGSGSVGEVNHGAGSSDVEEESSTILMWEHWSPVPLCQFTETEYWLDQPPQNNTDRNHFSWLHYDGANTLWADGHAKRMIYDQLRRWMFGCHKSMYPNWQG